MRWAMLMDSFLFTLEEFAREMLFLLDTVTEVSWQNLSRNCVSLL